MSPYYHHMILDKTTIKTRIRPHPDLVANPVAFVRERTKQVRSIKPSRGRRNGQPTWNLTFKVTRYKGIQVTLVQVAGDPLATATIEFNPGVCLHGHNGRIHRLTEFLAALNILVTHLTPLLSDPNDWVDLVPGLRRGGAAYWSYLEVLFQCRDTDGTLLARLRHLRHSARLDQPQDLRVGAQSERPRYATITTPSRLWHDSILVGPHRGELRLAIYRKAIEMAKRRVKDIPLLSEEKLTEDRDILRLEARMKGAKLVHYFGNGDNVEVIDGKERLVWFFPQDLVRGHRTCFSELHGVFLTAEQPQEKHPSLSPLGRMIADVASASDKRAAHAYPELLVLITHYTGASSDTIGKIRKAGLDELSRRSPMSSEELFSDEAYATQFGIASEVAEQMVRHDFKDTVPHRLIAETYRPPDQPFHPHTELPTYILRRSPDEDDNHENDR
jgi:hypothetical protein